MSARSLYVDLAADAARQAAEPDPADLDRWQAEMSRTNRAYERTPVAMVSGAYGPCVVTKDGSLFELRPRVVAPGETVMEWHALPPVPGSAADMARVEAQYGMNGRSS